MGDFYMLAGCFIGATHVDFTCLDGNAVIAQREMCTSQQHMLAAFRVKAVRIGAVRRGGHRDTDELQIIAEVGMQVPRGAVAHADPLQGYMAAAAQENHPPTPGNVLLLTINPPVCLICSAIQLAGAINAHILHVNAGNQCCKGIQRIAFPCSQIVVAGFIRRFRCTRQDREAMAIRIQAQFCPFRQFNGNMAFQEQGRYHVLSLGNQHPAFFRAAQDSRLNGGGIIMDAIAYCAKAPHVQGNAFNRSAESNGGYSFLAVPHFHGVVRIRPQAVQVGHHTVGSRGFLSIDAQGIGLQGMVQSAVFQLKCGTSARNKQTGQFHVFPPIKLSLRHSGIPHRPS